MFQKLRERLREWLQHDRQVTGNSMNLQIPNPDLPFMITALFTAL
jgi:hypothetical protein